MITGVLKSGTSGSKSLMSYLLGKDSNGKDRDPAPEIVYGDRFSMSELIDSTDRKHKYTSMIISFRDNEKPTDKQINEVLKDFRSSFMPNIRDRDVPMFGVKHLEKGNTELHIIILRTHVSSGKAFNCFPPGQKTIQLSNDFDSLMNHKLGYEQVSPNPFKAHFSEFDRKCQYGKSSNRVKLKNNISEVVSKKISYGMINNRDQLIDFFRHSNIEITRTGKDYISIKPPGFDKPVRLKGPLFEVNADYKKMNFEYKKDKSNSTLTPEKLATITTRLNKTIDERKEFNDKVFAKKEFKPLTFDKGTCKLIRPKRVNKHPSKQATNSPTPSGSTATNNTTNTTTVSRQSNGVNSTWNNNPPNQDRGRSNSGGSGSTMPAHTSAGTQGIIASAGSIEVQLAGAIAQLSSAKNPAQAESIKQKVYALQIQLEQINNQIREAKAKEFDILIKPKGLKF
jgi:hypothetical protein